MLSAQKSTSMVRRKDQSFGIRGIWVSVPAQPLSNCVTLGKFLNLSEPHFSYLCNEATNPLQSISNSAWCILSAQDMPIMHYHQMQLLYYFLGEVDTSCFCLPVSFPSSSVNITLIFLWGRTILSPFSLSVWFG